MNTSLLLQKIHGHVALLGLALLLHPVASLRGGRPISTGVRVTGISAALVLLLCNALGWLIYPQYRMLVRPRLYRVDPLLYELFEIKEHLAWFALVTAIGGGFLLLLRMAKEELELLRRPVRLLFALASLLVVAVAVLGLYLSSVLGFSYVS
jgi:hypothetical protein